VRAVVAVLLAATLVGACATPAAPRSVSSALPEIVPYSGSYRQHLLVMEAEAVFAEKTAATAADLERHLGLTLDPERRRTIGLADGRDRVSIETRVSGGNSVQEIRIPASALARGEATATALLREALCRAAESDLPRGVLPDWFVRGAAPFFAERIDRLLHERILAGPEVVLDVERVAPRIDLHGTGNDPVTSALFLRFLSEEFGGRRLPALTRSLLASVDRDEAFAAALDTDPQSLPVAFDGYRLRVVGGLLDDEALAGLADARRAEGPERASRLAGLSGKTEDPYVAAAILEDLALARFEAGDFETAAALGEEIARKHWAHAFHDDRNRFIMALALSGRKDGVEAERALLSFLRDYAESPFAPRALLALAEVLVAEGRAAEAEARLEELTNRYPGTEAARRAHLALGKRELQRRRYGLARGHFERATPLPEAEARLRALDEEIGSSLPGETEERVRTAVRELALADEEARKRGVRALAEIGPRALPLIDHALGLDERLLPYSHAPVAFRLRLVEVCRAWTLSGAISPLTRLLTDPELEVAGSALGALLAHGLRSGDVARIIDEHPYPTGSARAAYRERFGAEIPEEVRDLLASEYHEKRMEAARLLGALEKPGALESLARLAGDASPQVRREAAAALGHRSEEASAGILAGALSDPSPLVRLEAVRSLARLSRLEPIRDRGLADADGRVRIAAGRVLLEAGGKGDAARVVKLLEDGDAGVRVAIEGLLETLGPPDLGPALADALRGASESGLAMRVVRVMARRAGSDFGYDPGGDAAERRRVADAFLARWRASAGAD
jgi:HEAT repeat protein